MSSSEYRLRAAAVMVALLGCSPKHAASCVSKLTPAEVGEINRMAEHLEALQEQLRQVMDCANDRLAQEEFAS